MSFRHLPFVLHSHVYTCEAFLDTSEYPYLVFVILEDPELISKFGEEITIKTDLDHLLPRTDDQPALTALRQAILDALQQRPEWTAERRSRRAQLFRALHRPATGREAGLRTRK